MTPKTIIFCSLTFVCAAALAVVGFNRLGKERSDLIQLINTTAFNTVENNGISINYIQTRKRAYFPNVRPVVVLVDPSTDQIYTDHIRDVYAFFSRVSGIPIRIEKAQKGTGFTGQKYFYVGNTYENVSTPTDRKSAFIDYLQSDLTKEFPNNESERFWKYLEDKMYIYQGTTIFFNSDFKNINYGKVMDGDKYNLSDVNVDKTAIFVSSSPIIGYEGDQFVSYVKMFIAQEAIQDFNLTSDASDERYALRTLLYDDDWKLGSMMGAERARLRVKQAATGICPLDVMTTMVIAKSYGRPLTREDTNIGPLRFLWDYTLSYYYYLTSPKTLFDKRCW